MRKEVLIFFVSLALVGCKYTYVDVGGSAEYSHLIGSYETLEDLAVHGVTEDTRTKLISVYHITRYPGLDGPEVVTQRNISPGSNVIINRVMLCTNCIFLHKYLLVDVSFPDKKGKIDIYFDDLSLIEGDRKTMIRSP